MCSSDLKRGRKSTSGGTIMLGCHLIRTYSKTQATIAKSSGESELYALVRASAEGLGMATLLSDFGAIDPRVSIGMDASAAIGIAQRNGLNKVRHVEVDVLWLQEQMARRLLPIGKIPGPQNPSDMCTKNVGVALIEQYLKQLNIYYEDGRAQVAQQLHAMGEHSPVLAVPQRGTMPGGVIGGRMRSRASTAQRGTKPGVISDSVPGATTRRRTRTAEERGVDDWMISGVDSKWKRAHRTPRRALFTPHRVSGGPGRDIVMDTRRKTEGVYVGTGVEFVIEDDYSNPMDAHRVLPNAWVGTTTIYEKAIVAVEDVRTAWADMDTGSSGDEELNIGRRVVKTSLSPQEAILGDEHGRRLVKRSLSLHEGSRVDGRRLVKGSLSSLCVSARGLVSGCWAAGIPRAGTEAVDSSHAGEVIGRRLNGLSRQAAGVSRSEAPEWPRESGHCLKTREYFLTSVYPEPSFRPQPVQEISSDSQGCGRGGVSRLARIYWRTRPASLRLLYGQTGRQFWGHLLIDRKPEPNASAGIWLKRKRIPESCPVQNNCSRARGLAAVKLHIHCCMVAERTV